MKNSALILGMHGRMFNNCECTYPRGLDASTALFIYKRAAGSCLDRGHGGHLRLPHSRVQPGGDQPV